MKKLMIALVFVAFLFSALPVSPTNAAPLALPVCSIPNWNYNGISGGCTCYVAERVKSATGKSIPWGGDASAWWANASGKWTRSADEPRVGAIAAFSYGHVAYVDSVNKISTSQPVMVRTQPYTTYLAFPFIKRVATATLYSVTETYTVKVSQKDYNRILKNDNTIRYSEWKATKTRYYWEKDTRYPLFYWSITLVPQPPAPIWKTPRGTTSKSGSNGLQGYIYP
jgi:hypothetical protein